MRRNRAVRRNRRTPVPRNTPKINWKALFNIFMLFMFLTIAGIYVFQTPDLDIDEVRIEGAHLADSVQLDDIKEWALDRNIILFPKKQMVESLMGMHEIKAVRISRHFPDIIKVRIFEKQPVASLKVSDGYAYIGCDGLAFHKSNVPAKGFPVLYAAGCDKLVLGKPSLDANFEYVVNTLKSVRKERLGCKKIFVDRKANLCLNMNSGLLVKLGQPDDIPNKIRQLRLTLEYKPSLEREALYVDVSCPDEKVYMPKGNSQSVL